MKSYKGLHILITLFLKIYLLFVYAFMDLFASHACGNPQRGKEGAGFVGTSVLGIPESLRGWYGAQPGPLQEQGVCG